MLRFLDGPAAGVTLACTRAPMFLRVVRSAAGAWDALDQLGDAPDPAETVHVYRRVGGAGSVRVQEAGPRGRGRRCRWYASAVYRVSPAQPDDATARDTAAWREWCLGRQREEITWARRQSSGPTAR